MTALDARLAAQNLIAGWRDCASIGRPHAWRAQRGMGDAVLHRCTRCPVMTRTTNGATPRPYLGGDR